MTLTNITYTDKETMNENAEIPAINKCQAADMNEIKNVINGNNQELGQISDFVVAGSSTFGSGYIKYESGTMIQWGEKVVTDAVQTQHGALYRTANSQIVTFQEKFGANYPVVYLTAQANLNFAYISGWVNNGIDGFQFFPLTVGSSAAATRYVKWLAIGRWKA